MESYRIGNKYVIFTKPDGSLGTGISKEAILKCAEEIKRTNQEPRNYYPTDNVYLCINCNNYGFPSVYTLITPTLKTGLCTECANGLRNDGKHDVDTTKMEIRPKTSDVLPAMPLGYIPAECLSPMEIQERVIQAEKEIKEREEKRKWQWRACEAGICPDCGCGVVYGITEYRCKACNFTIKEFI
jgi:hypothetical protein